MPSLNKELTLWGLQDSMRPAIWVSYSLIQILRGFSDTCCGILINLFHTVAEEIESASIVIPRSMLASVALNGTLGVSMVLATLFCLGSAEDALGSPTGLTFIQVFVNATGSKAGATAMVIP